MSNDGKNFNLIDRVAERLAKEDLGGLIKEDDLIELVDKGMQKAFFEPRTITNPNKQSYNDPQTIQVPSFLEHTIQVAMTQRVEKMIKTATAQYLVDNPQILEKALSDILQTTTERLIIQAVSSLFESSMSNLKFGIEQNLRNSLSSMATR